MKYICQKKIKIQTYEIENQNVNHMQSNIGNVNLMHSRNKKKKKGTPILM